MACCWFAGRILGLLSAAYVGGDYIGAVVAKLLGDNCPRLGIQCLSRLTLSGENRGRVAGNGSVTFAGISGPHIVKTVDCRIFCGTAPLVVGVIPPLHVLQELGGWSDASMVRKYAH